MAEDVKTLISKATDQVMQGHNECRKHVSFSLFGLL